MGGGAQTLLDVQQAMIDHHELPVRDRHRVPAAPELPRGLRGLWWLLGHRRRRRGGRTRLAYLDAHFPWQSSGFRYHEARELLRRRPDTLFFSRWEMTDPFPAPVHSLTEFPRIALREGVTDVYGVFLIFLRGLCGLAVPGQNGSPHPMEGPDLWGFLRRAGIRVHGAIYPGGGFTHTESGYREVTELSRRLDTALSYVPDLLERVPGVVAVPQAFTDIEFYAASNERWKRADPLVCVFAADAPPRKGVDVALGAFRGLDEGFHLHVVGPHLHRTGELPPERATFHGWLSPDELRRLYRSAQVFLSPVRAGPAGPPGSFEGVTDGFPTQSGADAMSSGCLLVSANPAGDHRVFSPGVHYVPCKSDPLALRETVRSLRADQPGMRRVADAGAARVRECMDIRVGVDAKLAAMGLP